MAKPAARAPSPDIALALGAGGARGLGQIVALEALDELGIRPAIIAGSSIGAILGAAYAAGLSGADLRAFVLERFRDRADVVQRLLAARVGKFADLMRGRGNPVLVDGERILDLFWPDSVPDRFEALRIPFVAVATDFHSHAEVRLARGPLTPAVAASLAIPGVVRPVMLGGRVLIDGGAVAPLPYDGLFGEGRIVVALAAGATASAAEPALPSPLETILGASQILMAALTRAALARRAPDILIQAGPDGFGSLDFFNAESILAAAAPVKDELKRRLSRALEARAPPARRS